MGMHFGLIGIKSNDSEKVLVLTDEYYNQSGLSIVEERIGNKNSKYTTAPTSYPSLTEYDRQTDEQLSKFLPAYSTNFDFYENLVENPEWKAFLYNPQLADHTLNINKNLASFLSKNLNSTAIEYLRFDIPCYISIRMWMNGDEVDEFVTSDFQIETVSGYFKQYENRQFESFNEVFDLLQPYFVPIGFNPESKDFAPSEQENRRRPMYLKGKPESVEDFLTNLQATF